MQKIKAKIITALLLAALSLTLIPLAFASSGNILINDTTQPQDLPITAVPAGGNVTLYFGDISFSGSQFYLLLSQNGLSEVSTGDIRYTPLFNVAQATSNTTILQVSGDANYPGAWTVGQNWINGSTPINVAGGTFYIKAFDGAVAALAVSQGFPVSASLRVIPAAGSAGTSIIVSANAFAANSLVNFSYVKPDLTIVRFANLVATNSLGQVNITMPAPDQMVAPGAGLQAAATGTFIFTAQQNGTSTIYNASYTETQRGLVQIGKPSSAYYFNATTGNVFGNMSRFDATPTEGLSTISVGVGNTVRIAGTNFYPGVVTTLWDNSIDVAPTGNTASATGSFNETFTVPATGLGSHNITLIDANLQVFVVFVNVVQSITVSPTTGPIGTTVTVTGYGFPSSGVPAGNVYNATITFAFGSTTVRAWTLTGANGQFTTTFNVPSGAAGGANEVRATTNDTIPGTFANATFTVTSNFILVATNTLNPSTVVNSTNPTIFYANSSNTVVAASGTGFTASTAYFVAIDNQFSPFTNTTNGVMTSTSGVLNFTFIGVGFQSGLHVVAIYASGSGSGTNTPTANATFTVLGGNVEITSDVLTAINNTVTQINSTVTLNSQTLAAINASVVAINGNVATLATSIGTLTTTVNAIGANVTSIKGTVATIQTSVGTIQTLVTAINANITGINSGFATVQTSVGTLTTTVSSIGSTLTGVSGTVGTISTTVGTISTDLSSIGTKVTSIQGTVATIQTDLGTLTGTVTSIQGNVATIQTNIGTLQASVDDVQTSVDSVPSQVNIPIWIAVVLALIAAIAAIASLLLVRRKIAG